MRPPRLGLPRCLSVAMSSQAVHYFVVLLIATRLQKIYGVRGARKIVVKIYRELAARPEDNCNGLPG